MSHLEFDRGWRGTDLGSLLLGMRLETGKDETFKIRPFLHLRRQDGSISRVSNRPGVANNIKIV